MKNILLIIIVMAFSVSCSNKTGDADAFGTFEATEIVVSAETTGRIVIFDPVEGSQVDKDGVIALIDTTLMDLQRREIEAGIKSVKTRLSSINAQNEILMQQMDNLEINISRISKMLKDDAATQKQYDDLTGQAAVIQKQIAANIIQKESVMAEISVYESKKATLNEQIRRSCVRSPIRGSVIEKYSEAGEMTAAGKPLAKIADMALITLKVYVGGGQLVNIKTGEKCTIRTDDGDKGFRSFEGTVAYVSDKAEFTPKIIQTKEERVALVYAVDIKVINDGSLKSGMPGEALFSGIKH